MLLFVATLILFAPTLRFEFLNWDDHSHVVQNPYVASRSLDGLAHLWRNAYLGFYIPVTYTVWWLQALVFGMDGGRFHAVGLLVHALNVALVYDVIRRILVARKAPAPPVLAAAGALLFAVHPLRVEAVAWVTAMKDLLSTTFALLAIRSYFGGHARRAGLAGHIPRGTVWFLLALLSKPAMVVLGPLVAVLDIGLLRTPWRSALRSSWLWFALAVPFGLITTRIQPVEMLNYVPPLWFRPLIATDALYFYLTKLVAPLNLAPVYGRTPEWLLESGVWRWTWVLPVLMAAGAIWAALRGKYAPLGLLAAFVLALAPVLGLIPSLGYRLSVVADHYVYFPFLFVAAAVSLLIAELPARRQVAGVAVVGVVSVLLAVLTFTYLPTWRDDLVLLPYAVEQSPRTALLRMNYGVALANRGMYEDSLTQFRVAAEILPHKDVYSNIGSALARLQRYDEARTAWERALELDPTDEAAQRNLSELERRFGR